MLYSELTQVITEYWQIHRIISNLMKELIGVKKIGFIVSAE